MPPSIVNSLGHMEIGPLLKVSSDRLEKPGIKLWKPHLAYNLHGITHFDLHMLLGAKKDKDGEASYYPSTRTLWLRPRVSPHKLKTNSLSIHHQIRRVSTIVYITSDKEEYIPEGL